jgi:hypothetical protein
LSILRQQVEEAELRARLLETRLRIAKAQLALREQRRATERALGIAS